MSRFVKGSLVVACLTLSSICFADQGETKAAQQPQVVVYEYGDHLAAPLIELWKARYEEGWRDLILTVESEAEAHYLNQWIKADGDQKLVWLKDQQRSPQDKATYHGLEEFLQKVKAQCPETQFHGVAPSKTSGVAEQEYISEHMGQSKDTEALRNDLMKDVEVANHFYQQREGNYETLLTYIGQNLFKWIDGLEGKPVLILHQEIFWPLDGQVPEWLKSDNPNMKYYEFVKAHPDLQIVNQLQQRYPDLKVDFVKAD